MLSVVKTLTLEYTLTDRLPQFKIKTVDPTMAKAELNVLVDELTEMLLVAKVKTLAYTLTS